MAMVNGSVAPFRTRAPPSPILLIATKPTLSYLLTSRCSIQPGNEQFNGFIVHHLPTPHREFLLCRYRPGIASVDQISGPASLLFTLGLSRVMTQGLERGDSPSRVHTFMYAGHLPGQATVPHTILEVQRRSDQQGQGRSTPQSDARER